MIRCTGTVNVGRNKLREKCQSLKMHCKVCGAQGCDNQDCNQYLNAGKICPDCPDGGKVFYVYKKKVS